MTDTHDIDIGLLMAKAYQEFVRELRAELSKQFDASGRSDGFVLRALANGSMTVSALAGRLEISKQGAAQIVDDMHRRGLVARRSDPQDGRARPVELSPQGWAAVRAASAFHQDYERRLNDRFGRTQVVALREVLTGMAGGSAEVVDPHLRALYL